MKPNNALARIRQLCFLDLDSRVAIPSVIEALQDWVPFGVSAFFWADHRGQATGAYGSDPAVGRLSGLYAAKYANRPRNGEPWMSFADLLRSPRSHVYDLAPFERELARTEVHNEVFRPAGVSRLVLCPLAGNGGEAGMLSLHRGEREMPFSTKEKARLASILPYLGATLGWHQGDQDHVPDGTDGLLLIGLDGRLQHACPRGRQLLHLAAFPEGLHTGAVHEREARLLARVTRLAGRVSHIQAGRPAPPPVLTLTNAWGKFRFRASLLQAENGAADLVGVRVEHLIPVVLKLARGLDRFSLSPRLREVALLLGRGWQNADIAAHLGLSPQTLDGMVKDVVRRAGVANRRALREALLRPA